MVITMAKLRMAHASTHGAHKPPGPKEERLNYGDNNCQATHGARKHAWRTEAAWAKIGVHYERCLKQAQMCNKLQHCINCVPEPIRIVEIWDTQQTNVSEGEHTQVTYRSLRIVSQE